MNDKFILMGIDDERSKKVAEILGNKTCKKIIDLLAETSEASEKDIADLLGMPLNTVEYNLKKLLDSNLVEKTKNFFWSRKGKKIPMYKLANKHLVISPKSKPSMNMLKTIIPLIAIILIVNLLAISLLFPSGQKQSEVNRFNSLEELNKFIKENTIEGGGFAGILESGARTFSSSSIQKSAADSGTKEYSTTNIQVEGVDEADIVKSDGKYIYSVSGNKVSIVDAYPAENMKELSEVDLGSRVLGIFVNQDDLVIFSEDYETLREGEVRCMAIGCVTPPTEQKTNIYIYDVSDRSNPKLEKTISISGSYYDSRMIDDYAYIINNQYIYSDAGILPAIESEGKVSIVKANEIYYSPIRDTSFQYTIILAVNVKTGEVSEKVLLTGGAQTIYVSKDNIYTSYTKYPSWNSPVEIIEEGAVREKEKTIINKFSIDKDKVTYVATGEVLGQVLNQFSMDEHEGKFRIATTIGEVWNSEEKSQNNVYVLDENLNLIGKLEGLAPGEKIYSVRFMGDRGYVVTFKKVDPLFVIDLSDSKNPNVLGKLKIPGYSDYLHPYDENHIIGVGKEAVDAEDDRSLVDFAWYQGVKIAIFDVSDVENPVELHKIVIGDRGTDSDALHDHKAFLFDREKELLVLPITLAEIPEQRKIQAQSRGIPEYGDFTFQGAYVYKINLEDGFELKGRITHYGEDEVRDKSGYYWSGDKNVKRSLYIDDVLYTISDKMIKANELDDLREIVGVEF